MYQGSSESEADALLVFVLPVVLLGSDWNADGTVEYPDAQVGDRNLPLPDQPEIGFQHETAPRLGYQPAQCLVHDAPDP